LIDELSEIRNCIEERMIEILGRISHPRLYAATRHLVDAGGKRFRALIPALITSAIGSGEEAGIDLGASLELIHTFTLVHDDIMDQDSLRRGRPTVHIAFDEATAINAGDAMFAVSMEALADSPHIRAEHAVTLVRAVAGMVRHLSDGQQMDVSFESEEANESDYLEMIAAKTGSIFRIAGWGGALISEADQNSCQKMEEWGIQLGLCFQIIDDLIDLLGDEEATGKPIGSDLIQGKRTLVIIHAENMLSSGEALALSKVFGVKEDVDPDDLRSAIAVLQSCGAIEVVRARAKQAHEEARKCLEVLPQNRWTDILIRLTDLQVERSI